MRWFCALEESVNATWRSIGLVSSVSAAATDWFEALLMWFPIHSHSLPYITVIQYPPHLQLFHLLEIGGLFSQLRHIFISNLHRQDLHWAILGPGTLVGSAGFQFWLTVLLG